MLLTPTTAGRTLMLEENLTRSARARKRALHQVLWCVMARQAQSRRRGTLGGDCACNLGQGATAHSQPNLGNRWT